KEVIKADYRFAVIYTAPTLKDLQNREEKTRFQKVYLDDNDRFVVPILPKNNQKYIALSFVDRYGVETAPMIFKIQSKVILPAEE
ncbi:MAG: glycoside hydrolase, partial [Cyclobacteriaceae bacterium]|nr:glycoside hydrolase [Cyclobacteriaceae bacterium]